MNTFFMPNLYIREHDNIIQMCPALDAWADKSA